VAEVAFHPEAQAEYEAALCWYQERSRRVAARFEAEVGHALSLLDDNPDMFPAYDEDHRFTILRRFPYTLVYHVQGDHVVIVAVAHSYRKPGYWQGRQ